MKRDMDLIREILLWMEGEGNGAFLPTEFPPLANPQVLMEHLQILKSGGLLETAGKFGVRISWEGHEFVDKVRDPEIWQKTKDGASKVGSWSIKLLADLAAGFIRAKAAELGLPLS